MAGKKVKLAFPAVPARLFGINGHFHRLPVRKNDRSK
jgi:hypothetical protein